MPVSQDDFQLVFYWYNAHLMSHPHLLSQPSTCYVTLMPSDAASHGNVAMKDDLDWRVVQNRMVILDYGRNDANSSLTLGKVVRVALCCVHLTHLDTKQHP